MDDDPRATLRERADQLVKVAHLAIIGLPLDLADRFPAIDRLVKSTRLEEWDFFGTVAGSGTGILQIPDAQLSREDAKLALDATREALGEWRDQWIAENPTWEAFPVKDVLDDFVRFVRKSVENGIDLEVAVGGWVLWNVKGDKPSTDELAVAPVIGGLLLAVTSGS